MILLGFCGGTCTVAHGGITDHARKQHGIWNQNLSWGQVYFFPWVAMGLCVYYSQLQFLHL